MKFVIQLNILPTTVVAENERDIQRYTIDNICTWYSMETLSKIHVFDITKWI